MEQPALSTTGSMDFRGLPGTAVVTGGTGGVGSALCALLLARGSRVVLTYREAKERADAVVALAPEAMHAVHSELSIEGSARGIADAALARFGAVHTFIHAAGPTVPQVYLSTIENDLFERHLIAEAAGFLNVVRALLPSLRETRGAIVAVTTVATRRFPPRDVLSSAPKAAVEALVRSIAAEEGRYGVRANCVGPGILSDGMAERLITNGDMNERSLREARRRIPLRRFGTAQEVAEAACFLASPRASYISGQYLAVDGGYTV